MPGVPGAPARPSQSVRLVRIGGPRLTEVPGVADLLTHLPLCGGLRPQTSSEAWCVQCVWTGLVRNGWGPGPPTVGEVYQDHLGPRVAEVSGVQVIQRCLFHSVVGQ